MKRFGLIIAVAGVVSLSSVTDVMGLPQFKKAFEKMYIKSGDHPELKASFKKAACNVCHVKGEPKRVHNSYGEVLEELIEGDAKDRLDAAKEIGPEEKKAELAKLVEEFVAVLPKAEGEKNDQGETYGERIKAGKLPVDLPVADEDEEEENDNGDGN